MEAIVTLTFPKTEHPCARNTHAGFLFPAIACVMWRYHVLNYECAVLPCSECLLLGYT